MSPSPSHQPRRLDAVRALLTPEQGWTAGICMVLTVAVLAFGHPSFPLPLPIPPLDAAGAGTASPPLAGAEVPVLSTPPLASGIPPASASPGPAPNSDAPAPSPPLDGVPAVADAMRVIALAVPGGIPGRDDEAAARAAFADSALDAEIVVADPLDPGLCARLAAESDIVVAGLGLGDPLRSCLAGEGVVVLAFDGHGSLAGEGGGAVVSTRRGLTDSLAGTVNWGLATGALRGKVGVVAAGSAREQIEQAAPGWQADGLDLVATAFIADDAIAPRLDDVRHFAAAGVDVVLFAVTAGLVGRWALLHTVLDPAVRFVVADTSDSVWDETYPPVLDGALALTSLRVPWFAREKGETASQTACRQRWEQQVVPPTLLAGDETVRVYAWCQHVAVLEAVSGAAQPAEALAASSYASPLTSDLGPLRDGSWGPSQDAVLSWQAACTCWRSVQGFDAAGTAYRS